MSSQRQDLARVIAFNEGTDSSALAHEIAAYLIETRKTSSLESLLRDVLSYREAQGHVEAQVTTAHDISDQLLSEVEQLIKQQIPTAKNVILNPEHDANVVGGLKVQLANQQLDLTVRAKLDKFKQLTTTRST